MIKSITVTNYLGESLKMELARPELSGFAITSITGLGPGKATINKTEVSTMDGDLYNSARVGARNIVISLRYLMKNTIEEARQLSYKYFPLKRNIKLLIETDKRKAEISGYVESNEPDIFSKEEGAVISIICPYPYFYSAGSDGMNTIVFSGVEAMFEFPFSNESTSEDLIVMGSIQHKTEQLIRYLGDTEVGIVIKMHAVGEVRNVVIHNVTTREIMRIDTDKLEAFTGSTIEAGDEITIVTIKGQKSITLLRDGVEINILNCLDKNVNWFSLHKGDNIFAYTAEYGNANLQFKIEHRTIYEGV